jgi:hypothetical protein
MVFLVICAKSLSRSLPVPSQESVGTLKKRCFLFFTFELHFEPNLGPIWLRQCGSAEIKALLRDLWLTQL